MRRIGTALTASVAVSLLVAAPASAAKPPAEVCDNADPGLAKRTELSWPQQVFDPADAVWPHSTGKGVTVAVVDSGVDSDHPQLRRQGKVLRGDDFWYEQSFPGNFDCSSHGTAVASLIAATRQRGVGFAGLAPDATILPVRVTERESGDGAGQEPPHQAVAQGIRYAADQGADVINVSLALRTDSKRIRAAVKYAQRKDAVVVAAVGAPGQGESLNEPSYPASYPGVVGVGAVDNAGALSGSRAGRQVDIVAPGKMILAAARESGHNYYDGSSFAAPFVSATAALVRARNPKLKAKQVIERILATATPARGGYGYGAGMVNPYRAVTDRLSDEKPVPMAATDAPYVDPEREAAVAWWQRTGTVAMAATGLLAIATVFGLVLIPAARRARRRRWLASRAVPVSNERIVEGPPDEVFLFPRPKAEL